MLFAFYSILKMSDVELGGATVFLRLGARVAPSKVHLLCTIWFWLLFYPLLKGDAAFWYNLKRSGEQDMMTLHAACPVLVGSKWGKWSLSLQGKLLHSFLVCNKWIHEIGQELRLPCGLTPDE